MKATFRPCIQALACADLDDLEDVATLLRGECGEAAIVQDQQLDTRQALEEPCMTTVATCECERIEQPWHAMIEDGSIVATCLVAGRFLVDFTTSIPESDFRYTQP